jgi:KaiC/GvpD/RAD55 family RecA-like ATPase
MIGVAAILREHGRSALITQTTASGAVEETAPYLSTIADAILTLDYTLDSYEMNRTMRLIKMRGSGHETVPYRLDLERGGLRVTKMTPDEVTRVNEQHHRRRSGD